MGSHIVRRVLFGENGGYKALKSYQKSLIIYDGTRVFVRRFLELGDRTIDQMVQAARSGKQNIVEGSMVSLVSKEIEIRLTGFARASLVELLEDYQDYLRVRMLPLWDKDSPNAIAVRRLAYSPNESYQTYQPFLENYCDEVCANIMICLIHQCTYLLRMQINKLNESFTQYGANRERMKNARLNYRTTSRNNNPPPPPSPSTST